MAAISRSIMLSRAVDNDDSQAAVARKRKRKRKKNPMDRQQNPQTKKDLATLTGGKNNMPSMRDLLPESDPRAKKRVWGGF